MDLITLNANSLSRDMDWLESLVRVRMTTYLENNSDQTNQLWEDTLPPPNLQNDKSVYAEIMQYYDLALHERLVVLLALAPFLRPQVLDPFIQINPDTGRLSSEVGGLQGTQHSGFLPTGETAVFLIGGHDMGVRIRLLQMFQPDHSFGHYKIAYLDPPRPEEPPLSGALRIGQDYLELFTFGKSGKPNFNSQFPARLLSSSLEWNDLVLDPEVREQVQIVRTWVEANKEILRVWEPARKIKPGYRALFYGPPGTGKTLTATLIGKGSGKDVYLIDASMIVSKWIGETEKNLAQVFDQAENKDWILFFDEADALFGKRTQQGGANERSGNQQTGYLLQRTENFPGTVILATNLKGNIDEAFMRRFQSTIYFPFPSSMQRLSLWEKTFSGGYPLEEKVRLSELAEQFELSGGSIVNVLKYCAIKCAQRGIEKVLWEDLCEGVRRELVKDGRRV